MNSWETKSSNEQSAETSTKSQREYRLLEIYCRDLEEARAEMFPSVRPVQWAWYDLLSPCSWSWFVTLTFELPIHPEQAVKRWKHWVNVLDRHPSRRPRMSPVIWARGDELQQRGVLHFHGLIGNVLGIPEFIGLRCWQRLGGGFGQITPYDRSRFGALYVVKSGDVELSDPFWAPRS